ncbi:MAG: hypothetical protein R3301_19485, partial [Saprospiraceae bacterium]|nr:hypothetical protein [Saprospiraceae bacterium]
MFGRLAAIPCILLLTCSLKAQDTLTAIYAGEIPTYDLVYDNSCNGPATTLSVMLPAGDNFEVTNVHIAYTMTAATNGWMSDQRSKVRCVNSGVEESEQSGAGDTPGTMVYDRNATIANGTYIGGTVLEFEMWALRTWGGVAGCNTQHNKVDSGTWTITVFLGAEIPHPNVGIRTATPAQSLDVNGKIRLGDDATPPVAGTMRWNS